MIVFRKYFGPFIRAWRIHYPLPFLLLGLSVCLLARAAAQSTQPTKSTVSASAMEELPARLQSAAVAQQSGDVVRIAAANRSLLAVGLRSMAEVKLTEGNTAQAIDLYKQSLEFENAPAAHIALAFSGNISALSSAPSVTTTPWLKLDPSLNRTPRTLTHGMCKASC